HVAGPRWSEQARHVGLGDLLRTGTVRGPPGQCQANSVAGATEEASVIWKMRPNDFRHSIVTGHLPRCNSSLAASRHGNASHNLWPIPLHQPRVELAGVQSARAR